MERCNTCKHWRRNEGQRWTGNGYVTETTAWGVCELFGTLDGKKPGPGILAYAKDYESYQADFDTHEDFGCVQHESREDGPE